MLPAILNHLWQSTAGAGIAWLLTLALRKNHARVRHGIWLAASVKFLIPISLLIALGSHLQWRTAPNLPQQDFTVVMDQVRQPFTAGFTPTLRSTGNPLPSLLLGIWLCGFIGIACSWYIRWRRIGAVVDTGSPIQLGLAIKTISSPTPIEPGIFGIFRPILLLPEGIFKRLTPTQLKSVIAHELCHVRRRDNLIAAIHMSIETAFWFHPLVWWIGKRMVEERERGCDEEVVQALHEPRVYAEGILNVCKLYSESPLVCVSGITGPNLRKRIETIIANRAKLNLTFPKKAVLAIVATTALLGPIAIGIFEAPSAIAQQAETSALSFEVASIKLNRSATREGGCTPSSWFGAQSFTATNCPLSQFIVSAYDVTPAQISGQTDLLNEQYDILAKTEGPTGTSQMKKMLQTLLAERFRLGMHRETKETHVYALVIGKDGPKFRPSDSAPVEGVKLGEGRSGQPVLLNASMKDLIGTLSRVSGEVDRIVLDKTGLNGRYDLEMQPIIDVRRPDGPSVFTAVQTLGLKLEPQKDPVEFLLIDHIEKPTEN